MSRTGAAVTLLLLELTVLVWAIVTRTWIALAIISVALVLNVRYWWNAGR